MEEKENNQDLSPGSSHESASHCSSSSSSCSTPEVDVVACTPRPVESTSSSEDDQKRYFCQRCLNHKQQHPRKGHKPFCKYANCECCDCRMVEERRRLNNMLSRRRLDTDSGDELKFVGKKVRDPKCALCSAHGEKQPLRGHKKAQCPFLKCGCHLCGLVENRRTLMARQIKLRRDQQKQRRAQLMVNNTNSNNNSMNTSASSVPLQNPTTPSEEETCAGVEKEKEKFAEPLRVPPLMPVPVKPSTCPTTAAAPFTPLLLQPTTVLPSSPMLLPTAMEPLDIRLMPSFNANYSMLTPYSCCFHFAPLFPTSYTTGATTPTPTPMPIPNAPSFLSTS